MHAIIGGAIAALSAQSLDAPKQPPAITGCEIHVWAAEPLHSLTEGAVFNNVIDSAITPHGGRVRERAVPRSALDPDQQRALLASIDFAGLFHAPGAAVTIHTVGSKRTATRPATDRQTDSGSPCYMEVTIAKNFFNRSTLGGRALRTLVIFDDYRDQPAVQRSFIAWGTSELRVFPAKEPENEAAADAELQSAFKANIAQFAGYAFAPVRKK